LRPALTRQQALDRAREVSQKVATHRDETDRLRRVSDETIADFLASGLLKINQAQRWGGSELGLETVVDAVAEVARADGSSGWVLGLLMSHAWLVSTFGEEAQREVWQADPDTLVSSSFVQVSGTCERSEGGYRISGRWPFSSGSDHCRWAILGITILPSAEGEPPTLKWGLVPREDYRVDDDWKTVALRGTGSNSILVDDAFVPEHRTIDVMAAANGTAPGGDLYDTALFRLPALVAFPWYLAAPAIGVAQQACEEWQQYVSKKAHVFSGEVVGEQAPNLVRLGSTAATLASAQALVRETTREIDRVISGGGRVDPDLRARSGRDSTFAVRSCIEVVEELMQFSGGNGLFETHPVQKAWRDVHGVGAHVTFNPDASYAGFGRFALGLPPAPGSF
jgi:3-hydroxy-9,10-secoandrosta-1,3,5(10)-triene-9,17-dione monooxygenase